MAPEELLFMGLFSNLASKVAPEELLYIISK
jgi:hypothetical protein